MLQSSSSPLSYRSCSFHQSVTSVVAADTAWEFTARGKMGALAILLGVPLPVLDTEPVWRENETNSFDEM